MDRNSRIILRNTMRFLSNKGYKMITEFALPNKKRVDLIGINREKKIIIIEVKSNFMSIKKDKKWENYLNYCNLFYFALSEVPEKFKFKKKIGFIKSTRLETKIVKDCEYIKMKKLKKNKIIFNFAASAASKFHRLVDPFFKKRSNNSIYIYKNR